MNESLASKIITAFKVVAFAEALTWVWLLIGMYGKWVGGNEEAVAKPGMTHGIVFMVLVVLTLAAAYARKWDVKTLALGLLATVLPFCSVVFEVWAQRAGKLDAPAAAAAAGKAAPADAIGG
ncbi:DUF3817 domain-containing protein [Tsukamurella tyrosinosolvens]|uniref:Integral membrane protein n=1 Tax=Tsukamurella tyrosinosolvens TaxID=57704 RepID=A0A1H4Q711_TSUTY|nr:DUF3817 domain-containing protein [Tsukamurella tyrosinosolvens]AUN39820.1 hypothetical protein ASU32_07145 [Tsukamurella tyrosinosolvens]KXO91635.1 hypothetical protein AXK58_20875 [Tsukamurella tyrosinosolvens]KXP05255.1 hypothetical protein AXK59_06625 [Tsukamurella tyrosinosolvens]KZL94657.1 hypothetical protein AXX05_17730 [Tsukamurella tyrosinosolvens]MCA4994210.1 DUF3817 domain-containing protein [Tsukamurella tyrosinosolvens]